MTLLTNALCRAKQPIDPWAKMGNSSWLTAIAVGTLLMGTLLPGRAQTAGQTPDAGSGGTTRTGQPAPANTTSNLSTVSKVRRGKQSKSAGNNGSKSHGRTHTMTAVPPRVVLILPPDLKDATTPDAKDSTANAELGDLVIGVEQGRLATSGAYHTILFSRALPSVRRALNEQTLSSLDIKAPFDSDAKARRLAQVSGYDMVLETFVNSYTYDPDKNELNIVMTARLIDLAGVRPLARNATEQGVQKGPTGQSSETQLALELGRDLTERLMSSLLKPRPATVEAAPGGP